MSAEYTVEPERWVASSQGYGVGGNMRRVLGAVACGNSGARQATLQKEREIWLCTAIGFDGTC